MNHKSLHARWLATHLDSSNQLHRSHITQYQCGYCKESDTTVTEVVTVKYPYSRLNSTPTSSSHTGTVLCETHIADQEESECVLIAEYGWQS